MNKLSKVYCLRFCGNHPSLAIVYLQMTWLNGGMEAEDSGVADDTRTRAHIKILLQSLIHG